MGRRHRTLTYAQARRIPEFRMIQDAFAAEGRVEGNNLVVPDDLLTRLTDKLNPDRGGFLRHIAAAADSMKAERIAAEAAEDHGRTWAVYLSKDPGNYIRGMTREGAEDFAAANPGWIASTITNLDLVIAMDFP